MSSGERAKPPATYQERNPFDISRRSQTEVAAEIAQRMAAWKQARGRSYAAPGTPAPAAEASSGEGPQPAAPVQPARAPRFAERAAQDAHAAPPPAAESKPRPGASAAPPDRDPHAPFFAAFSVQRAMPPAPSPKQSAARPQRSTEAAEAARMEPDSRAVAAPQDGVEHGDPLRAPPEPAIEALATMETAESNAPAPARSVPPDVDAGASLRAEPEATVAPAPGGSPATGAAPRADSADGIEARRAQARDIRARWMAAHAFEETRPTGAREPGGDARALAEMPKRKIAFPGLQEKPAASAIPPIKTLGEMSGRTEPTFDVPAQSQRPADAATAASGLAETRNDAQSPETPATKVIPPVEALDKLAGRKEPTFAAVRASEPAATQKQARGQDKGSPARKDASASAIPPTTTLDMTFGGREPMLDEPPGNKHAADAGPSAAPKAPRPRDRVDGPAMQTRIEARRIQALRADPHMAVQRSIAPEVEPETWDIPPPILPARPERRGTGWAIGLGAILLIIGITAPAAILRQGWQAASVDQNQAELDPVLPQQQANQQPARTDAPVATPPSPQQAALPHPDSTAQQTAPSADQAAAQDGESAAVADAPPRAKVATESDAGQADAQGQVDVQDKVDAQDDAGAQDQAAAQDQAPLGPVRDSGELNDAPISAPPAPDSGQAPRVNLASQEKSRPPFRQASPMVARPFTPAQRAPRPFLPTPTLQPPTPQPPTPAQTSARVPTSAPKTVGAATVPIDGAPAATIPGGPQRAAHGVSIGLGPSLIPVLKPKAPAARADTSARETTVRKPRPFIPQSFDQMFQTLVDTLSEGKQPNPDLQPEPPSTRK